MIKKFTNGLLLLTVAPAGILKKKSNNYCLKIINN